jgi:uncharacterized membrane protein
MKIVAAGAVLAWLSVMVFFAGIVAPAAFTTLDREAAGRFVSVIFPRYYLGGTTLGAVALAALVARAAMGRLRLGDWLPLLLVVVMVAATLYAWLVILPAAHAARAAVSHPGTLEALIFARLHRLSGVLNGVTMVAGVLVLVVLGVRR